MAGIRQHDLHPRHPTPSGTENRPMAIRVWDPETGSLVRQLEAADPVDGVIAVSRDGALCASGREAISVWEIATGKLICRLPPQEGVVTAMVFADDKQLLVANGKVSTQFGFHHELISRQLTLWDVATSKQLKQLELPKELAQGQWNASILSIRAISPDARFVVTAAYHLKGGYGSPVKLWDARSGKFLREIGDKFLSAQTAAFSADGTMLATLGRDKQAQVWNVATGAKQCSLDLSERVTPTCAAFSPNGQYLAVGDWLGKVVVFDVFNRRQCRSFEGSSLEVTCLAFSPDSSKLVSGSDDTTGLVWEMGN